MRMKLSLKKTWEENICLLIIALSFVELQTEAIHDILKWPLMGLGIIVLVGCYLFHKVNRRISALIVLMIFLAIAEVAFSEGILATQYIWDLGICMPVSLAMYYAKRVNLEKWIALYILVTMYLLFRLVTSPDHYTIFYSHSRNYISVFEIFLMFMATVAAYKNKRELPGWMYYSTAIVCVLSIGRGGILAGFVLLGFHILQNISKEKNSKKTIKIAIILVVAALVVVAFFIFGDAIIQRFFPRFTGSGVSGDSSDIAVSKRLLMWSGYINECFQSTKEFLLGADPYPIVLRFHYRIDFNLHNSFLMTHVFYGIIGLMGIILYSIRFIRQFIKVKSEMAVIFISFLVRALTDHCFPGKLSAIILWYSIFYVVDNLRKKQRRLKVKTNE